MELNIFFKYGKGFAKWFPTHSKYGCAPVRRKIARLLGGWLKKRAMGLYVLPIILCFASACTKQVVYTTPQAKIDGKYDMAYPFGGDSKMLENVVKSVRLINATVYYERYIFDATEAVHKSDITPDFLRKNKDRKTIINDFRVGTATIIYAGKTHIAVLTCDHVVNFPDTLFTYFGNEDGGEATLLHQIAVKRRQENFVTNIRQGDGFKVLISDAKRDVAILGKELLFYTDAVPEVFSYPVGSAKELGWGSLLYMVGFPSGKKMVTTGIVSSPNRNPHHDFLLDALFNRGFSGGLVLAVRDGLPNFELVGIVNAVAADNELVITPGDMKYKPEIGMDIYYNGPVYAGFRKKINYGISFGISIDWIRKFIRDNKKLLADKGFHISGFFNGQL